jgi:hypothetical protein
MLKYLSAITFQHQWFVWDELFAKVDEDIANLHSMKISPYYKAFEEEVKPWDKEFSNIEYLKTLSQAKSLEKKLQGTYGSK